MPGAGDLYLIFDAICESFRGFFCEDQGREAWHVGLRIQATLNCNAPLPPHHQRLDSARHTVSTDSGVNEADVQLMFRNVIVRSSLLQQTATLRSIRPYSSRTTQDADEEDIAAARSWLSRLHADTIRQNTACDISFSRSSGPGGQNVNKCVPSTPTN